MQTTAIRNFKTHPAQMRTTHDIGKLAELTLQIYERGLNEWQPIVASPNEKGFYIVSGHRRHISKLLSFALSSWVKDHPDTNITVEVVETMIIALTEKLGSLDNLITSLKDKYGDEEIPYVPFAGDTKAQVLALQAANYGSAEADPLGIAHSFKVALEAGASPDQITRNAGQKVSYVTNHLALATIPPELAQRIAAGDLPMSVGTAVAELPEPKKTGLSIFILANSSTSSGQASKITAKEVKSCADVLKKWNGLHMPMMFKHQSQKNIARALVRLWSQVVEAYPEDAYAAASMLIFRGVHDEPWASQDKLTLWFQALGGDTYFTNGGVNWTAIVQHLVTEVSCETCPINQLPKEQLRSDLSGGQGGPLGMPCRVNTGQGSRCIHGLAANDSVEVRVPMDWGGHPCVVNEGGDYRVKSYADLLAAWEAQHASELAEDEAEKEKAEAEIEKAEAEESNEDSGVGSAGLPVEKQKEKAVPAKDSPIAKQRELTATYMKLHEQFGTSHPFATSCAGCRHKLDKSPTKDESVPHCAWAGCLRGVEYKRLHSDVEGAPEILVCRQYAPSQPWTELIPDHPKPSGMPRAWMKAQIVHLVKAANNHGSNRNPFEFLTGRPMGANESHSDWFAKQLDEQMGDLSDAQLFTLMVWAFAEWQRASDSRSFSLPVNRSGLQFADYNECKWEPD
ncbi:MAG: ParB/RepB/Spo0J family partition protein [Chloroflexi bacterium]|nr:ParB/RepB/Spo0J family partition protein [Chloroflexota bacterium]